MKPKRKLGDLLVASGTIDEAQLAAALGEQKQLGRPLGMTLVRMGFVDEETLIQALASQLRLPVVKLAGKVVNPEVLERVPIDLAEKYRCLPLLLNEEGGQKVLYLAMEDPADLDAIEELGRHIGDAIKPVLVAPTELDEALHRHYHWAQSSTNPGMTTDVEPDAFDDESEPEFIDLPGATGAPVAPVAPRAPRVEAPAPARAPEGGTSSRSVGVPPESILRALTQLLVEKGVITRDELIERVQSAMREQDGNV
jgi:type IV pilus assembly protein PilB